MTTLTTNNIAARAPLVAFGTAVLAWLEAFAEARSRRDQIAELEAKTDAELARMGLRRDRIVHHVFRDTFYL